MSHLHILTRLESHALEGDPPMYGEICSEDDTFSLILATALVASVFLDGFLLRTAKGPFFNWFVFFWFGSHGLRLQQGGQNIFDIKWLKVAKTAGIF